MLAMPACLLANGFTAISARNASWNAKEMGNGLRAKSAVTGFQVGHEICK
jgi:hypothetical protein